MLALRDPRIPIARSDCLPGKLALFGETAADRAGLDELIGAFAALGVATDVIGPLSGAAGGANITEAIVLPAEFAAVLVIGSELEALCSACARTRAAVPLLAVLACFWPAGFLDEHAVGRILDSGADDLLFGVPAPPVLLTRLLAASRMAASRQKTQRAAVYRQAIEELLDVILCAVHPAPSADSDGVPLPDAPRDRAQIFQQGVGVLCRALGFSAGALVLNEEETNLLLLIAEAGGSLEDSINALGEGTGTDAAFPLADCPELRAALNGGRPTMLVCARERSLLRGLVSGKPVHEGAALFCPVAKSPRGEGQSDFFYLFLSDEPIRSLPDDTWEFLKTAAQVTALGLRGRNVVMDALRNKTRRVNLRGYAEERRREAVLQYREFFESSTDGMMILDGQGQVLYLNRSAEQMTGYAAAGISGRPIFAFVPENQRDGLLDAIRQVIGCTNLLPFDLQLTTTSGETLILSVSTSSVLADHGCAVLSFRDVTEQRILEHELRKTKDFLERLIDSTVDGIVAADMYGNVILFNQGAARITGYAPEEVISHLPVWRLYPEGEARRTMMQLRSGEHGGPGRLLQSRRTLLGKNGVAVPVSLTASIIYEEGREVATVGVVADLRERLHIEQRLQQAQEMLVQSEKQALIAELAGTAAHELNQPLTSVMGYAGLLRRRLPGDNPELLEFLDIIVRESERMAELVRKIGRITRYETKPYVGEARIIDLDKSALPEAPVTGEVLLPPARPAPLKDDDDDDGRQDP